MAISIVIPETVLKRLNQLPKEIRIKFWQQLEKLAGNPAHPGLRNEKLEGTDHWAFSITMNYRATYLRHQSSLIITAIGTNKEVLGN